MTKGSKIDRIRALFDRDKIKNDGFQAFGAWREAFQEDMIEDRISFNSALDIANIECDLLQSIMEIVGDEYGEEDGWTNIGQTLPPVNEKLWIYDGKRKFSGYLDEDEIFWEYLKPDTDETLHSFLYENKILCWKSFC